MDSMLFCFVRYADPSIGYLDCLLPSSFAVFAPILYQGLLVKACFGLYRRFGVVHFMLILLLCCKMCRQRSGSLAQCVLTRNKVVSRYYAWITKVMSGAIGAVVLTAV